MPLTDSSRRLAGSPLALVALGLAAIVGSTAAAQSAIDTRPRDTSPRSTAPSSGNRNTQGTTNSQGQQGGARNRPGLGGGTSLDRNLQRGSGGINQRSPVQDFAARNFLVTDSVAGGRGFRGSVGYSAAEDFRGATGGDTSFAFRANSALSSTYFLPMSTQDRFGLAQDMGLFEFRRDATPIPITSGNATTARIRLDRSAAAISSGRTFEYSAEPTFFASGSNEAGASVEYLASPVQGLRIRRADDVLERSGLSTFERARVRRDATDGRIDASNPISPFISPLFENSRNNEARRDAKIEPTLPGRTTTDPKKPASSYDQIVQRIVERYGDDPNVRIDANPNAIERAKSELDRLRDAMNGRQSRDSRRSVDPANDPLVDPITGLPRKPVAKPTTDGAQDPAVDPTKPEAIESDEDRRKREDEEVKKTVAAAAEALRHGTTVHDLTPGERARVDELVRNGQEFITTGDFFRGERCFDQALELNPDNPLLYAGLAHCQIGAGLHLSAALTLRTLFANHPEMIDTRYDRTLLPNETRMRIGVETLRKRIALGQDADGYGLALAYIGHQLQEKPLITEGLDAVKGTIENDLLSQLLRQIWLSEPAPQDPASEKPAESPKPEPASEK